MKIFGVGTDIVRVSRIRKACKNKSFLSKLFSNEEIKRCKKMINKSNCFAKRFAAKEAFSKALGTGVAKGINFKEIMVLNEKKGKPFIKLLNKTKKNVDKKFKNKKYQIFLSLSDEKNYAVAFVTISI